MTSSHRHRDTLSYRIAQRSAPQDAPDFTRGAWQRRPPLGIV
jgi:hypothetical protein